MSALEKIISDARLLVSRLRDQDEAADQLLTNSQSLFNRVEAMKQYEEDVSELNALAQHRPRAQLVVDIARESRQLRELRAENQELRTSVEEYQSALELIMSKYRQHIEGFMEARRTEAELLSSSSAEKNGEHGKIEKICEMAAVMQEAVAVDDASANSDQERIAQLELENRGLREMLQLHKDLGTPVDEGDRVTPTNEFYPPASPTLRHDPTEEPVENEEESPESDEPPPPPKLSDKLEEERDLLKQEMAIRQRHHQTSQRFGGGWSHSSGKRVPSSRVPPPRPVTRTPIPRGPRGHMFPPEYLFRNGGMFDEEFAMGEEGSNAAAMMMSKEGARFA